MTARSKSLSEAPYIAVVDDDASMRQALSDLLQVEGLPARTYAGADAFLEDCAPGRFSLLVTDLKMPYMDGFELLRRLRAEGNMLPAIVITSACDAPTKMRAAEAGALACLPKPVADAALLNLIAAVLGQGGKSPAAA